MWKLLFMLVFLIPLLSSKKFWILVQGVFFIMSFMFLSKFHVEMNWMEVFYSFGFDVLSGSLIFLSFWICSLMILASFNTLKSCFNSKMFVSLIILLLLFLCMTFLGSNMLLFYISFEASLIPTLLLIVGWGYQPERLQAGVYLLFYTLFASLPLLMGSKINFFVN